MNKVDQLVTIWDGIPRISLGDVDSDWQQSIDKYLDLFQFGDSFYVVFNTRTTEMEYISPQVEKVTEYKPSEFKLSTVVENIHPEDLPYYYHYEQSAVRFFSNLPPDLILKYKFSYDYRLKTKYQSYKRLLQQIIPLQHLPQGGARTLAIFTDLTHLNLHGIPKLSFIGMQGAPSYYNVHATESFHHVCGIFSKKETEVLSYVVRGFTSEAIAQQLNRSVFTVQTHRKNILRKSGCHNISELIVKSVREGWVI